MPKKTAHYRLNQWAGEDDFLRVDFNQDNAIVDAALAAKAEQADLERLLVTGVYVGDAKTDREVELGFRPRFLLTVTEQGIMNMTGANYGGVALDGYPMRNSNSVVIMEITDTGFALHHSNYGALNLQNVAYYYLIIR